MSMRVDPDCCCGGAPVTRREVLARAGTGLGLIGLASVLDQARLLGGSVPAPTRNPLSPKAPPLRQRAKRIIHIYLSGGPSHIDTFDPKPLLQKYAGKPLPSSIHLTTERPTGNA